MKTVWRGIVALGCLLSLPAHADAIDEFVERQMQRQHIPGLALAVIKDSKPIRVQGYGTADVESGAPVTPDTRFKIGSVSKQFIAAGVLSLVESGKLQLNDTIAKYLSDVPEAWKNITVEQLLSHTSGLSREPPGFDPAKVQPDADVIKSAYALPLLFTPGERAEYSNLGYFVLADIIRVTSGVPWQQFIQKNVFTSLRMDSTGAIQLNRSLRNDANGYVFRDGSLEKAPPLLALRPSGAFASTINDLIRWELAITNRSVLSAQSLERMFTAPALRSGQRSRYGLGLVVESEPHRHVYHDGRIAGFRAQFSRYVDAGVTVIVLANIDIASADAIAFNVAGHYIPGLVPTFVPADVAPSELQSLEGSYMLPPLGTAKVERDRNALVVSFDSMGLRWRLLPKNEREFVVEDEWRLEARFERAAEGAEPTLMFISHGSPALRGTRQAR